MTDTSSSPPHDEPEIQIQNPNSPHDDENPNQQQNLSQPESPQTKTLESTDPKNPDLSELNQTQNQDAEEEPEDPQILDQKGDQNHLKIPDGLQEQSGMSSLSSSPYDPDPPILTSPTNASRRPNKRKKAAKKKVAKKKLQAIEKKIQTLTENLNPIPFVPSKTLNFDKHEKLLKRLGLWDFVHIEFDRNIRVDLVTQLIVNYDSRSRASYVNDLRIAVNRADLARALKLPVKKAAAAMEAVDLDSEAFSEESIAFVEDFVSNWVLLHEDTWMMPDEVLNWTKAIKDGHPEKVDWAGLLWFMVENELIYGHRLKDCYYAAHLQCLVKSQREEDFWEELNVEEDLELMEEDDGGEVKIGEEPKVAGEVEVTVAAEAEVKDEEGPHEVNVVEVEEEEGGHEVNVDQEPMVEVAVEDKRGEEDRGEVRMDGFDDFQGHELEENVRVEELNVELTLGKEIVEKEEVKEGDMMDIEESEAAEEQGQWLLDGKNSVGDHFLQRCSNDNEERRQEEEEEEDDDHEERKLGEEEDDDEEDKEEEEEEAADEEFNLMSEGNNSLEEGDMLTGNLLHGMETTGNNLLHGIEVTGNNLLHGMETTQTPFGANLKLIPSRTETHSSLSGGPLIFGNCSKREIDNEDDIHHDSPSENNKRLRTDGPWSRKSSEFEIFVEEMQHSMQQWMGKARMMYKEKEQAFEESNTTQQILFNELQRRDRVIEHLHKTKCEDVQKKDGEIYRLERELYVMGNLLDGYRKALKETRKAFSEYRQNYQLPEEPIYKDAGPGGIVLSNMELEKQRLKREEEDKLNRVIIEQKIREFEEEEVGKFKAHFDEVQKLDMRLVDSENQVKLLKKELSAKEVDSENQVKLLKEELFAKEVDSENQVKLLKEELSAKEANVSEKTSECAPLE